MDRAGSMAATSSSNGRARMIEGDDTAWERGPLERLVRTGQLSGYRHAGFWRCVDTPEDLVALRIWRAGKAPWLSARGRTQGDRAAQ